MESNSITPQQQLGEDIRAAKAIFEHRFGEQTFIDVNMWLDFAKEVIIHLKVNSYQEALTKLEINGSKH